MKKKFKIKNLKSKTARLGGVEQHHATPRQKVFDCGRLRKGAIDRTLGRGWQVAIAAGTA